MKENYETAMTRSVVKLLLINLNERKEQKRKRSRQSFHLVIVLFLVHSVCLKRLAHAVDCYHHGQQSALAFEMNNILFKLRNRPH